MTGTVLASILAIGALALACGDTNVAPTEAPPDSDFVLASNYDRAPMGMLRDGVIDILQGEEPDRQINSIGYLILDQGDIEGAIEILDFNATLYPEVGNTYDSLGEAYLAKGDDALAIQSYSKALEIDPDNDHAGKVLQSLGALPADQ